MQKKARKFVAYFRVSTKRQGESGLGLDAQREAIARCVRDGVIVAEFTEIESGKRCNRPELGKAIEHCRLTGATLIVGKWDRLARDLAFTATLMRSNIELVAADNPHASRLTLHILAAVAEHEGEMISTRIREALAAAKARGRALGGARAGMHRFDRGDMDRSAAVRRGAADEHARRVLPVIEEIRGDRVDVSLQELADGLNVRGVAAPRGGAWAPTTVWRALKRAA